MKRFICIFWLLRTIALATTGAAVLGVWMPGAGAYVSEDWRSDSSCPKDHPDGYAGN